MQQILQKIREELKENVDSVYKSGAMNFFKEPIELYGVRAGIVRKIARKYWREISIFSKKEIFDFCEKLLQSNLLEESTIAFFCARKMKEQFEKSDFVIFENWLEKYVNTWSKCDDFCTHSFGELIFAFPELLPEVKKWRDSENRWLRRASSVIFIYPIKQENPKQFLTEIFSVSQHFIDSGEKNDLVQKGYGWTLKVAADFFPEEVFDFVLKNKEKMPRTALRYAIEKMPKDWKKEAMKLN